MKLVLTFTILGKPQPAGSKKGIPYRVGQRCRCSVVDANDAAQGWKDTVATMARVAMRQAGLELIVGFPIGVQFDFTLKRPAKHYRTGRNSHLLRDDAPEYPTSVPDALKLSRAVEDGMTGSVYGDDAAIIDEILTKRYGDNEGVEISIFVIPRTAAEAEAWKNGARMPFQF